MRSPMEKSTCEEMKLLANIHMKGFEADLPVPVLSSDTAVPVDSLSPPEKP